MNNFDNIQIFEGMTLAGLFKKIHKKNRDTEKQLNDLVEILRPMINNAGAAVMLMPTVKDLIDVNVRNNEQLVKMAGIVQKGASNSAGSNEMDFINLDEINQLVEEQKLIEGKGTKLLEIIKEKVELKNEN